MNNLGKPVLFILLLVLSLAAIAQKGMQDMVYLRNGTIVHGMVIEQMPVDPIKIQTADLSAFIHRRDEVTKITKEEVVKSSVPNTGIPKGREGLMQLGFGIGIEQYGVDRLKINYIYGYRFCPQFMTGLGLGIRAYTGTASTDLLAPIFLHLRYTPLDRKASPYLATDLGTAFNISNEDNTEGLMLNTGLGVSVRTGEHTAFHIGFAFDLQRLKVYEAEFTSSYLSSEERSVNSSVLSFNVGFSY
ncbi:MAG: hypothetical protein KF843_14270 [Flavobacteriales bacterium]|nr:hypothetical protein [Flavobacteriales bacterium]